MFFMMSSFNLKPGISLHDFEGCLKVFAHHMQSENLIESIGSLCIRESDTPMDTDDQRNQKFWFLTRFQDKAQCDRSYDYILQAHGESKKLHDDVYLKVTDAMFVCFADQD